MSPTLTQIKRAVNDNGLRRRIILAADVAGFQQQQAELAHARIIAANTTDDGGSATTLATSYDYWWMKTFVDDITSQATAPADRDELDRRIAAIGTDPTRISDGTIQRAVAAVLTV